MTAGGTSGEQTTTPLDLRCCYKLVPAAGLKRAVRNMVSPYRKSLLVKLFSTAVLMTVILNIFITKKSRVNFYSTRDYQNVNEEFNDMNNDEILKESWNPRDYQNNNPNYQWREQKTGFDMEDRADILRKLKLLSIPEQKEKKSSSVDSKEFTNLVIHDNKISSGRLKNNSILLSNNGTWDTWPECMCGSTPEVNCEPGVVPKYAQGLKYGEGGTCSWRAWSESKESVISVSLYGPLIMQTQKQRRELLDGIKENYPDWSIWLYTRHPDPREMCPYLRSNPRQIFYCDTRFIPLLGDLKRTKPIAWKVSPLGDPNVKRLAVRNIDNSPKDRLAAAQHEWFSSSFSWHVMKDHPRQLMRVHDGQWSVRWRGPDSNIMAAIRNVILMNCKSTVDDGRARDIMAELLWPQMEHSKSVLIHDSFGCEHEELFKKDGVVLKPWPHRRLDDTFVGMMSSVNTLPECPLKCRPRDKQDWSKC